MRLFSDNHPHITQIYNIVVYYSENEFHGKRFIEYNGYTIFYELIYFLGGENITTFNGKQIHNKENNIEYLPKGIKGAKYTVDRQKHGHCIDIYFDTDMPLSAEALSQQNVNPKLRHLFERIEQIWKKKKPGSYARCMSIMYEIIAVLQETEYAPSQKTKKIEKSIRYLEDNCFKHDFSYKTLAGLSDLSYSYFKQIFIAKYGVPPSKYISNLKINYAVELLLTGRFSISQIAELTGFENVYYFSSFFKKETGVSPKIYLRDLMQ